MIKTYKKTVELPILEISYDNYPSSPREWSNLGYFITVDSHYYSPDKNNTIEHIVKETGDEASNQNEHMELIKKAIKKETGEKVIAIYPIVKYEHSRIVYKIGTVHNFDYSNNGFYIITDKTAKELGANKKSFLEIITQELDVYNKYINGEVYQFCLYNDNGEVEDSCCGFYDIEDIRGYLPREWDNVDLLDYFKEL